MPVLISMLKNKKFDVKQLFKSVAVRFAALDFAA